MDFIHIRLHDVLDILLVAFLMFQLYLMMRRTNAVSIFIGILVVYLLWILVRIFNMELLSLILGQIVGVGVTALIVVFQPEIRKFLFMLGDSSPRRPGGSFWSQLFLNRGYSTSTEWLDELTDACAEMSAAKTGALIVILRKGDYREFATQGIEIDSIVRKPLIESIFFKNSPLHDGAMIIAEGKIKSVGCILPVSQAVVPAHFGTRHRAALGATEVSDSMVIVVSEERGIISFVHDGKIVEEVSSHKLKELIRYNL